MYVLVKFEKCTLDKIASGPEKLMGAAMIWIRLRIPKINRYFWRRVLEAGM